MSTTFEQQVDGTFKQVDDPPKQADMVSVVRCRDCKRYHPKEGKMFSCKFEYGEFAQWRSAEPDGFCAWGERRDV